MSNLPSLGCPDVELRSGCTWRRPGKESPLSRCNNGKEQCERPYHIGQFCPVHLVVTLVCHGSSQPLPQESNLLHITTRTILPGTSIFVYWVSQATPDMSIKPRQACLNTKHMWSTSIRTFRGSPRSLKISVPQRSSKLGIQGVRHFHVVVSATINLSGPGRYPESFSYLTRKKGSRQTTG